MEPKPIGEGYARRHRYVQRGQNTVFDAIIHPKKRVVVAEKFFSGGEGDCVFLVFSDQDAKRMGEDGLFSAIDREAPRLIKKFSR